RERRRLERSCCEALFEIGALAGKVAEPATNYRGLAHDVGQIVLAFLTAALGLLEFVAGGLVLNRDFLERGGGIAAARRNFAREGRARLARFARANVALE